MGHLDCRCLEADMECCLKGKISIDNEFFGIMYPFLAYPALMIDLDDILGVFQGYLD